MKPVRIDGENYVITHHARKRFAQRFGRGFQDEGIINILCLYPQLAKGYKPVWCRRKDGTNVLVTILFDKKEVERVVV